jgi:hypothetical protein
MSRTTLCALTATCLVLFSVSAMVTRYRVLGNEVKRPAGPATWKVTMLVQGTSQGDVRVSTTAPLDFGRQHVVSEDYTSPQLQHKAPEEHHPGRRQVYWSRRGLEADGGFRLRCEYRISLEVLHPSAAMKRLSRGLYAPPQQGDNLDHDSKAGTDHERITAQARHLTTGMDNPADVTEALYRFVQHDIQNEPSIDGPVVTPAECLKNGSGDCAAKSRLLLALLRNRGIPARLVAGVTLSKGPEQRAHYWVEAWVRDSWLPMCPFHKQFGHVPPTWVVFGYGDQPLVRGRHVKDLEYAFLVEHAPPQQDASASPLRRFFQTISLYMLPPAEQRLVEFLLLLPVAALIICLFRNVIGLNSFGTFAPALVGLAFRDLHSLPGIFVFVSILLVGWLMRRLLDHYHLLQVPRIALMLSLIVIVLILVIVAANFHDMPATKYISLFPMIILTGMVERFWTLETEDSTVSSFKTLLATMFISATIAVVLSFHVLARHLFSYPETLGLIMAAQLLIGRYTGYRLMELFRFRDFLHAEPAV